MWGYYRSGSNLVDSVLQSLEGGTAMNEGKGDCFIMVDEAKYGNYGYSEKRCLISGPEPGRYLSHIRSSNYKYGRRAQG